MSPIIVYRLQPWAFVDRLVADLCPPGYELRHMPRDAPFEHRAALLGDAEYLMGSWVTTTVTLTEQDYAAAPKLKLVQLMSAGYEHVDLALASRHGVPVATFGPAMAAVVAEHTVLLILALFRRLLDLDRAVRSGAWRRDEPALRELSGSRVGLIGFGHIGRAVAARLRAFECDVVYASRTTADPEYQRLLLDELLATSDVVSLHVPLSGSTRGLIGPRELGLMKPSAVLVNMARGAVVNQSSLVAALTERQIAGAGLDVLDPEPPAADDPLTRLPNVVFTPHVGGQAETVWPRIVRTCFQNVERVARGEQPLYLAHPLD